MSFNKKNPLFGHNSTRSWNYINHGLLVPGGHQMVKKVRKSFQETPLETMKKTKTVEISKPALNAFHMELARLRDRYLDTASDYTGLVQFEKAAQRLGEEYGFTVIIAVVEENGESNVLVQTEEILIETAGEVSEYQIYADKLHGGTEVLDDLSLMYKKDLTDKEREILE